MINKTKNQISKPIQFFSRSFFPLFGVQFLSSLNANLLRTSVATILTYHAVNISESSRSTFVSLAIALFVLPFFLFSATAGQIVDKYDKVFLIRWIQFLEIPIMLILLLGFWFFSPLFLVFIIFLMGVQTSFFGPLKYSILPEQLPESQLIQANGFFEAGTFLAIVLGSIIGGLLAYSVDAGLELVAPVLIAIAVLGFIPTWFIPKKNIFNPSQVVNFNPITSTLRLIREGWHDQLLFRIILAISWFWLLGSVLLSQLPIYVSSILGADRFVFTIFLVTFSVGIGLGSIYCYYLVKGNITHKYLPLSALLMSVFLLDFTFVSSDLSIVTEPLIGVVDFYQHFYAWRLSFDLLAFCFFGGIFIVPLYASLQAKSPEKKRAQMVAFNNIMNALFMAIGVGIAIIIVALGFSSVEVIGLFAVLGFGVSLYTIKLLPDAVSQTMASLVVKALFRFEIKGIENYTRSQDKTVIIANHVSYLDALILMHILPESPVFAVNTMIAKKWWLRWIIPLINYYTVDPTDPFAVKHLIREVNQGKKIMIFPEGRISTTGSIMKVYPGSGLIADKTQADILFISISGAERSTLFSKSQGKISQLWLPRVKVCISEAKKIKLDPSLRGAARREQAANALYDILVQGSFEAKNIDKTIVDKLIQCARLHGWKKIVTEDIRFQPLHYRQLLARSFILGKQINQDTENASHVGLLLPTSNTTLISVLALHLYGVVPVMLNFSAGLKNISVACKMTNLSFVYTSKEFVKKGKLESLIEGLHNAGVNIIFLESYAKKIGVIDKLIGASKAFIPNTAYSHTKKHSGRTITPESIAVLLFTSGSEGLPKGVRLSHKNILANIAQINVLIAFNKNDSFFNALPMFHSFGFTAGTLLPVLSGLRTFLYPSPLHYRLIPEFVYEKESTIILGTDTFLARYAKTAHSYDFHTVRFSVVGAEKLKPQTAQVWMEKFGVKIYEGYGVTEASPVLAVNTPICSKVGSVGKLLPGIKHQLRAVPGVQAGGELMVKGSNLMQGYLIFNEKEQKGEQQPLQDWYATGDIVDIDNMGFVSIVGRVKRFAKIAGEMVSLGFVEEQIAKIWPNKQHAVITRPDSRKGEIIVLVTDYKEANLTELAKFFKTESIPELSIPRKLKIVESIPILGSGKVDYPALQELLQGSSD